MPSFNSTKTTEEIQRNELNRAAKSIYENHGDVIYCIEYDKFFLFDGRIYKGISVIEFANLISKNYPTYDEMNLNKKREIIEHYKYFSYCHSHQFNNYEGLNFNNGFFSLDKYELRTHDKKYFSTIIVPYDYDPGATCDLWEESLDQIFEGDKNKIRCLQEFFGYCLTRDTSLQKCMILIGDGANGKSLILKVLKALLGGKDNVSVLALKHISNDKRAGSLESKLVNICNEISKSIKDFEEDFKKIVDGDEIEVDPKFIVPYEIKTFCKLIFAVNELPFIDDKTSAFYRRLLVITCEKKFEEEEQNKKLDVILKEHYLPGIFNWSLQGLKRLKDRGFFVVDEYMAKAIDEIRHENNPILIWAKDNVRAREGYNILKKDAYEKYCEWCINNGHKSLSSMKFGKEFFRIFRHITKKDHFTGERDSRQRAWINLDWVMPHEIQKNADWEE